MLRANESAAGVEAGLALDVVAEEKRLHAIAPVEHVDVDEDREVRGAERVFDSARRHEEEQEEGVLFEVSDDVSEHRGVLLHVAFRGVEESCGGASPRFLEVSVVSGLDRAAPLAQRATRARTDPVFSWLVASG